jgi:hypothetical protein
LIPRLQVEVTEPNERPLGSPPSISLEPIPDDDDNVVAYVPPTRYPAPDLLYYATSELADVVPRRIRAAEGDFPEIEHEGLIVVIDSTSFLPSTTLETLRRGAARAQVRTLPVYVRTLG